VGQVERRRERLLIAQVLEPVVLRVAASQAERLHRMPWRRGGGNLPAVTASEPGEGPALAEREARLRERESRRHPQGMVPGRERRRTKVERGAMRLIATGGIIGIAVALGAILVGQDVAGWIVGLVVGLTSVILAALLWSSRQL
jgi:hypothetical protein